MASMSASLRGASLDLDAGGGEGGRVSPSPAGESRREATRAPCLSSPWRNSSMFWVNFSAISVIECSLKCLDIRNARLLSFPILRAPTGLNGSAAVADAYFIRDAKHILKARIQKADLDVKAFLSWGGFGERFSRPPPQAFRPARRRAGRSAPSHVAREMGRKVSQKVMVEPTALRAKAEGKALAMLCTAPQPVQCMGMMKSGSSA